MAGIFSQLFEVGLLYNIPLAARPMCFTGSVDPSFKMTETSY